MRTVDKIISCLLVLGMDDWVHLTDVVSAAQSHSGACGTEQVNMAAIEAITAMLGARLVEAGDLVGSGKDIKFCAWPVPPEAAIARIATELARSHGSPDLSGENWFSNTKKGDEAAARGAGQPDGELGGS
jgi:hypothetical protein